jgi:hypothetical protein
VPIFGIQRVPELAPYPCMADTESLKKFIFVKKKYPSLENDMTDKIMKKRQCQNNSFKITIFLHGTL